MKSANVKPESGKCKAVSSMLVNAQADARRKMRGSLVKRAAMALRVSPVIRTS